MTAFKAGDGQVRRGGPSTGLGVEFDVYWLSPDEVERRLTEAGFATVFWGGRPAEGQEGSPAGISARAEVLKPTRSALANTRDPAKQVSWGPAEERRICEGWFARCCGIIQSCSVTAVSLLLRVLCSLGLCWMGPMRPPAVLGRWASMR